ncbi:MAG: protein translocase SEC61 complex subunit gamma [archaeon]
MAEQTNPGVGQKLQSFFLQSRRVWQVLRKPTAEEFKTIAKVSALGILAIGAIGFIISDVIKLISKIGG